MAGVSAVVLGVGVREEVVFAVVVDENGGGLILLPGLSLAPVAFFAEGEIEVVAVEADPVALPSLGVAFDSFGHAVGHFLHRSIIGFHFTF